MLAGSAPSFSIRSAGSSNAGSTCSVGDAEPAGEAFGETMRIVGRDACALALSGAIRAAFCQIGLPSVAPEQRERPARQRLARIPFALAVMDEPARRELGAQAADQLVGENALGRAKRRRIPFGRLIVIDRDERRLAAHGEADVMLGQIGIDPLAERIERGPSLVGKRIGDARLFVDARDLHLEGEIDLGRLDAAADRRRRADNAALRRAEYAPRRSAIRRSGPSRSSRRPADRPRPMHADR